MNPKLGTLRTGDVFKLNRQTYIALALSPDPFDVFCLNTLTKKIEEIDESERVELVDNWYIAQIHKPEGKSMRGKKLGEL